MIVESSTIQKSEDLLMSIIDKEAVILGMESGMYIGLNEIATEIWAMLDEPVPVSHMIDSLADQFDEDRSVIRDQVLEFLNSLLDRSLIKFSDETQ